MNSFAQNLTEARQAAGLTQAELADAIHVARNTISGWEHGRSIPGVEVIRKINAVLNCDLLQGVSPEDPLSESADAETNKEDTDNEKDVGSSDQVPASPAKNSIAKTNSKLLLWKILIPVLLLAAVIIAAIVYPKQNSRNREYRDPQGVVYRIEDYAAVKPRQEGKPYFSVTRRLDTNDSLQMYTFVFTEEQGFPATIQRVDYVYFKEDRTTVKSTMTAKQLAEQGEQIDLPAYGTFDFVGGFPARNSIVGVGIELFVQDENGNVLSFPGYQKIGND